MRTIFFFCMLFSAASIWGQKEMEFKDRLFYGGDIQLGISSGNTVIGANPFVGYRVTNKLSAGIGVNFLYYSIDFVVEKYRSVVYGGNVFSRFLITDALFAQTEFHMVNSNVPDFDPATGELDITRRWIPIWYVGGGYRAQLGARSYATFSILYDLIDDPYSPYQNPMFRGGVSIGL